MQTDWRTHPHIFRPAVSNQNPDILILPLHGTGGDETSMLELAEELGGGVAVLSPRGNVLEGGRWPRFFRRFAEGQYDYPDLVSRLDVFADWLGAARDHYGISSAAKVLAVGYSNGANFAGACLLRHPGVIHFAVLLRPALDLPVEYLPGRENGTGSDMGQVVLRIGQMDPICPPAMGVRLAQQLLGQSRYRVVSSEVVGAGHDLVPADFDATAASFREWLGLSIRPE